MFVIFTSPHNKKPLLINPDLVRSASEVEGRGYVRLVMDVHHGEDVEGDLDSVWKKLMGATNPE
jgi:hypothetical protein